MEMIQFFSHKVRIFAFELCMDLQPRPEPGPYLRLSDPPDWTHLVFESQTQRGYFLFKDSYVQLWILSQKYKCWFQQSELWTKRYSMCLSVCFISWLLDIFMCLCVRETYTSGPHVSLHSFESVQSVKSQWSGRTWCNQIIHKQNVNLFDGQLTPHRPLNLLH